MNILDKMDDLLCACESTFDHDMTNVDNMLRVADMQFECTNNDIDLAIMKEAAYDDVHMMFEEANTKFASKVKAAAQKAIDAIKAFFEKLLSGLKELQSKAKEKLMSINVKNPFVGSKKVKGPDKDVVKKAQKIYKDFSDDMNKLALRVAAGDDISVNDVQDRYDDTVRLIDKLYRDEATQYYTMRELKDIAAQNLTTAQKVADEIYKQSIRDIEAATSRAEHMESRETDSPDAAKMSVLSNICNSISRIAQKVGSAICSFPGKVVGAFGKGIKGGKDEEKPVKESTESLVQDLEELFSLDEMNF